MAYTKKTPEEMKQQLQKINESARLGILNAFQSESFREYLDFAATFYKYSARNIALIKSQFPNARLVASYKDWSAKGRYVKKGEKGIQILIPTPTTVLYYESEGKTIKKKISQANENEKRMVESGEAEITRYKNFSVGHVFDVSQTEGDEIPELCKTLVEDSQEAVEIYIKLKSVIEIPVRHGDCQGSKGYYSPTENLIQLDINNPLAQNAKTLVHEYAHYLLHREEDEKRSRNDEEVEAESIAYVVCKYLGFDTSDYSFTYVYAWAGNKKEEQLEKCAETIVKTAKKIIEKIESVELESAA